MESKGQPTVALSTAEAELIALALGAQEAMWLRKALIELRLVDPKSSAPMSIGVDNNAAIQISTKTTMSERTKHLDCKYFAVREFIEDGHLNVERVDTADNTADIFTKPLGKTKFEKFRLDLGVRAA